MDNYLSEAKEFINRRPWAQHMLYMRDPLFDLRLYSFRQLQSIILKLYHETLQAMHSDLYSQIYSEYLNLTTIEHCEFIRTIFLRCYISASDRNHLLDGVFLRFSTDECVVYCESTVLSNTSAHDMIVEITQNFAMQIYTNAENEGKDNFIPTSLLDGLSDFPYPILCELFHKYSNRNVKNNPPKVLMIVLRHMEKIDSTVFGDLLERLNLIRGIRFLIIGAHSAIQELPLLLAPSPETILQLALIETTSALELFDSFMGKLFTTEAVLVTLHPQLLGHLYDMFFRAHKCVFNSVQFLLHCYHKHFTNPVSVLSTYRDNELLIEFEIIGEDAIRDDMTAINYFLRIMTSISLEHCGITIVYKSNKRKFLKDDLNKLILQLSETMERKLFFKAWFVVLLRIRDVVLDKDMYKYGYSSPILWAALVDDNFDDQKESLPEIIANFIKELDKGLKTCPLTCALDVVKELANILLGVKSQLNMPRYLSQIEKTYDRMDELAIVLADLMETLQNDGYDMSLSWKAVDRQMRMKANKEEERKQELGTEGDNYIEHVQQAFKELIEILSTSLHKALSGPQPGLPVGIFDMTEECVEKVLNESCSDIGKRIMNPESESCEGILQYDALILLRILAAASGLKPIATSDCFISFKEELEAEHCTKKPQVFEQLNQTDVIQCRFVDALRAMKEHGLVKISGGNDGKSTNIQMRQDVRLRWNSSRTTK